MPTYRAGVIGLGRMGSTFDDEIVRGGSIFLPYCHAPSYDASPHVELVAGADPHDEQRTIFGERWGLSADHLYTDHKEMLAKENLDVVSVTTNARIRSAIVQDVARSSVKAIWAEKPMAISLEEADTMVDVCREEGVALAINCARRWNPFFIEARKMIDNGDLGAILQVTGYAQCGLSHNGSHLLDAVRYMAGGDVQWVFGEMESDEAADGDVDLEGNGYLAFDNGVPAYIRATPTGAAPWEIDVIGEEGRVRFLQNALECELTRLDADPRPASTKPRRPIAAKYPFPLPTRMQGVGLTIVEDLVAAIETGSQPRCSGEDGRAALEIAIALRESHRRGGVKVGLPLEDRSLYIRSSETLRGDEPARIRRLKQMSA